MSELKLSLDFCFKHLLSESSVANINNALVRQTWQAKSKTSNGEDDAHVNNKIGTTNSCATAIELNSRQTFVLFD